MKTILISIAIAMVIIGCSSSQNHATEDFRMVVDDTFYIFTENGPTVVGRIESGIINVGDKTILLTSNEKIETVVISIDKYKHENLKSAKASQEDVGLTLSGIFHTQIERGNILIKK